MTATRAPEVVNLTPHPVVVQGSRGSVTLPSRGIARVTDTSAPAGELGPIDLVQVASADVVGLPDSREGVLLLVSRLVAIAQPERSDLLFPFGEIRDEAGRIIAVSALARLGRADDSASRGGPGDAAATVAD